MTNEKHPVLSPTPLIVDRYLTTENLCPYTGYTESTEDLEYGIKLYVDIFTAGLPGVMLYKCLTEPFCIKHRF